MNKIKRLKTQVLRKKMFKILSTLPYLRRYYKGKNVSSAKKYMEIDFSAVIFSDACRAIFDGADDWVRTGFLYVNNRSKGVRKRALVE